MKPQRIDPLTELGKKSPEMFGFVQDAVSTVFANYPMSRMTPEQMSRIEGDIAAVFDEAQARGASLPDRTIVALGFPASRHVRVSTVWHVHRGGTRWRSAACISARQAGCTWLSTSGCAWTHSSCIS